MSNHSSSSSSSSSTTTITRKGLVAALREARATYPLGDPRIRAARAELRAWDVTRAAARYLAARAVQEDPSSTDAEWTRAEETLWAIADRSEREGWIAELDALVNG